MLKKKPFASAEVSRAKPDQRGQNQDLCLRRWHCVLHNSEVSGKITQANLAWYGERTPIKQPYHLIFTFCGPSGCGFHHWGAEMRPI